MEVRVSTVWLPLVLKTKGMDRLTAGSGRLSRSEREAFEVGAGKENKFFRKTYTHLPVQTSIPDGYGVGDEVGVAPTPT